MNLQSIVKNIMQKSEQEADKFIRYRTQYIFYIAAIMIGIIAFLLLYGTVPLHVQNDSWVMTGYDETDILVHYAGWMAFRNSDWDFPLGVADQMAVGDGTCISFTDSIPWIAIFFKLIRKILPETFQYFGIYTLFCYMMQGLAGYKILHYKTRNVVYSLMGTVLFCFAPILLDRALRHTALGSHWLILFAIYIYFRHRDCYSWKNYLGMMFLEVFAIGIHPYFLPMVACFALLCLIEDWWRKKWISVLFFGAGLGAAYLAGCLIGALGAGNSLSRWGYGVFSMNLNALWNPTSGGGYGWSCFLKTHEQILGNYDGFNYLGVGIAVLFVVDLVFILIFSSWGNIKRRLQKWVSLIGVCIFLFCFAVSNVVTWNEKILFTIPFPEILLELCGIFRASSRLFYPVYYLIYIMLCLYLWENRYRVRQTALMVLLAIAVLVQLYDLHYVIYQKHTAMKSKENAESILQDDILADVGISHDKVILDDCEEFDSWYERSISAWAFKNRMSTYYSIGNSGTFYNSLALGEEKIAHIKEGGGFDHAVIVTTNPENAQWYLEHVDSEVYSYGDKVFFIYQIEDQDR